MEIVRINLDNIKDITGINEPFEIIGRLKPAFADGEWSYTEELLEMPYLHTYPDDDTDYSEYVDNPYKIAFLAYADGSFAGRIIIRKDWNKYAFIEDISVLKAYRGQGVGTALMNNTIEWAKAEDMSGLALETQDNNLLACRFYSKCGFVLGSVNTMLYKNLDKPFCDSSALYWYLRF
jgi:streptothricin acetyltransferase